MKKIKFKTVCAVLITLFIAVSLSYALGIGAYASGAGGYTWVFQNPLPRGENSFSTDALSATQNWSVGEYGTITYWNGTTLTQQDSGTTNNLNDVSAHDATHVWTVGEASTILFYNGTTWSKQTAPTLAYSYDLYGVSAADNTHVWAVGGHDGFNNAVILFYNGTTWTVQQTMATGGFTDVYAYSTSNVWAVSTWTWHYNGTAWSQVNDGSAHAPYQVSAYSTTNLWAIDWDGTILNSTNAGVTWNTALSGLDWPATICAFNATNIWIVGWEGNTGFYNGSGWSYSTIGSTDICGVDAYSATSVFACGDAVFLTGTGSTNWTNRISGTTSRLNAIDGRDANNLWTVGTNVTTYGNIQSTTSGGNIWNNQSSGITNTLYGVADFDATHLWVVGQRYVRFWSGGGWSTQVNSNGRTFYCVTAAATNSVWVGADNARVRYYNGGWATQTPDGGYTGAYYGISAADTTHVWAVGATGEMVYWDGSWHKQTSNTTNTLRAVTALNSTTVWAVGDGGVIRYTNNGGSTWQTQASGTTQNLYGVSAANATHVWAVGATGTILFYDGTSWTAQTSPTTYNLRAVFAYDANDAWAVGDSGTIIFADPPYIKAVGHGYGDPGDTVDVEVIGAYTNFQASDPALTFGDGVNVVPSSINVVDNTHILAQVQIDIGAALGPRDVNATTAGETPIPLKGGFVVGANPTIASVSPTSAIRGWTGDVEIVGSQTDFNTSSNATFGSGINVNSLSCNAADEVTANITVGVSAAPGPRSVNVTTGGETPEPLVDGFTVATPPSITNVSPGRGSTGAQVTIAGNKFGGDRWVGWNKGFSQVKFNGVPATEYTSWSDSQVEVLVPSGAASCPITVTTADGTSNAVGFAVNNPTPIITSLSPNQKTAGSPGFTMTVNGTGFVNGSVVKWNGSNKDTAYVSPTKLTASIPAPDIANAGTAKVTVFNPVPGGGTSNTKTLTITGNLNGSSSKWYLAEGSTAHGFDTDIAVENPNAEPVTIRPTFMTPESAVTKPNLTLPGYSSKVINPHADYGLESDFSTKIECLENRPIAVDRTMYWAGEESGTGVTGGGGAGEGHTSIGVTSPANSWYFAEGSSAWGFECWLLIQNPGSGEAHCRVTYMIEGAQPVTVTKVVPAGSRGSFNMSDDIGAADASIKVASDVPVVPERSMYRDSRKEGSNSIGTTAPAVDYYLSEGTTAWGFTTYVLVQNPNPVPADVTVTYMTPSGSFSTAPRTIPAGSRKTIKVNDETPSTDLSVKVHGSQPIIAEREMYWDGAGGEACHDSIGLDAPHRVFLLPGGLTGKIGQKWFETWTLVQNLNDADVKVRISYLTEDAKSNVSFDAVVRANSRSSFNMGDKLAAGRAGVLVECLTPGRKVTVERSTYWNERRSGANTIGGFSD